MIIKTSHLQKFFLFAICCYSYICYLSSLWYFWCNFSWFECFSSICFSIIFFLWNSRRQIKHWLSFRSFLCPRTWAHQFSAFLLPSVFPHWKQLWLHLCCNQESVTKNWIVISYRNSAINSRSWKVARPLTFHAKKHFYALLMITSISKVLFAYLASLDDWRFAMFTLVQTVVGKHDQCIVSSGSFRYFCSMPYVTCILNKNWSRRHWYSYTLCNFFLRHPEIWYNVVGWFIARIWNFCHHSNTMKMVIFVLVMS